MEDPEASQCPEPEATAEKATTAEATAAETTSKASADIPSSREEDGDVPSPQPLDQTKPDQTTQLQKGTPPGVLPPNWQQEKSRKRDGLLMVLGAFHVVLALLHLILGGYLASAVKSLHLVALRSGYPFWGAASFLISGTLVITMETFHKSCLKALCLVMNFISFLCVLAGFFVIAKDLFLENPFPSPVWRAYPHPTVHIQRLELVLLCFTFLQCFLSWSTAIMAWKSKHLSAEVRALLGATDP
ncbi:membrane-spanning 4-domains subfamily A member 10 [Dasypus novemcinctus]|uniref:membrane-spanning 4-domains subfamily A member 10 n=1 Tax=Dasypus novemcinctus TaxID=9361 RepID=UPI00265E4964|nr:membrane-spanning 4-domains subfamily A member 10 [Dasypus novemcinctus]